MDNYYEKFMKYVMSNYDITDYNVAEKYFHSMRVATLMIVLAKKLNLAKEDIKLAFQIGLFHDLGRFHEIERNKDKERKMNNLTFDHGAWSNKVLFNDGLIKEFDINEDDYLVIKKALYYHNKKDLDDNLTERELLFCKMIRDMDKLDIIYLRSGGEELVSSIIKKPIALKEKGHLKFSNEPNPILLENFMNDQSIHIKDIKSKTDSAIFYLSFIKDLYFEESFDMAINDGYLGKLLGIIDVDDDKKELFKILLEKVRERKIKDVREKVRTYHC